MVGGRWEGSLSMDGEHLDHDPQVHKVGRENSTCQWTFLFLSILLKLTLCYLYQIEDAPNY